MSRAALTTGDLVIYPYFYAMIVKPGIGIDHIVFGQLEAEIVALLGAPDREFENEDDENELIYQYNQLRLRLSFYKQEGGKMGYIRCGNPKAAYNGSKLLGQPIKTVVEDIINEYTDWKMERHDFFDVYLSEEKWIVLNVEYEAVMDIELGVPYNEDETYMWPA